MNYRGKHIFFSPLLKSLRRERNLQDVTTISLGKAATFYSNSTTERFWPILWMLLERKQSCLPFCKRRAKLLCTTHLPPCRKFCLLVCLLKTNNNILLQSGSNQFDTNIKLKFSLFCLLPMSFYWMMNVSDLAEDMSLDPRAHRQSSNLHPFKYGE